MNIKTFITKHGLSIIFILSLIVVLLPLITLSANADTVRTDYLYYNIFNVNDLGNNGGMTNHICQLWVYNVTGNSGNGYVSCPTGHIKSSQYYDIAITDSNGNKLPICLRNYGTNCALIEFRISNIGSGSNTSYYLYYGNSSISTSPFNPYDVYSGDSQLFDHFENGAANFTTNTTTTFGNSWIRTNGVVWCKTNQGLGWAFEGYGNMTIASNYNCFGWSDWSNKWLWIFGNYPTGSYFNYRISNGASYLEAAMLSGDNNNHIFEVDRISSTNSTLRIDDNILYTQTNPTYIFSNSIGASFGGYSAFPYMGLHWVGLRKIVAVEPTIGYWHGEIAALIPVAAFHSVYTTIYPPFDLQFYDDTVQSCTSWSWSFGDGNTSTIQNPTNYYSNVGTYTVSLTVSNAYGNNTLTKTNYITVSYPVPTCNFTATPLTGNAPLTVTFTDLSTYPINSIWDLDNNGINDSNTLNVTAIYNFPGSYTVKHYVSNPNSTAVCIKVWYIVVSSGTTVNNTLGIGGIIVPNSSKISLYLPNSIPYDTYNSVNGEYSFNVINPLSGVYTLTAFKNGYINYTQAIFYNGGNVTSTINFYLSVNNGTSPTPEPTSSPNNEPNYSMIYFNYIGNNFTIILLLIGTFLFGYFSKTRLYIMVNILMVLVIFADMISINLYGIGDISVLAIFLCLDIWMITKVKK